MSLVERNTLPSKSAVKLAGKRIRNLDDPEQAPKGDIDTIDTWRRSHTIPLSSIALWLRKPSLEATGFSPAQRLKRLETVLDKIATGRAKDASTMQDMGGCRIIFRDLNELEKFRRYLTDSSRAKHKLAHDEDKYNYLKKPKKMATEAFTMSITITANLKKDHF